MTHLKDKLNSLLPDEMPQSPFAEYESSERDSLIEERADNMQKQRTAAELARIKASAKRKLQESTGPNKKVDFKKMEEAREALEVIEQLEAQKAEPLRVESVAAVKPNLVQNALKLQGASRADMTRLLASLNINTSVQLSKSDTANLLACLLTCNETQLRALKANKKVPIAIKTIIHRLLEDSNIGNIETIEKLWDRIFGKAGLMLDLPEQTQLQTGIIPNTPVSREAYIIIRDTLL